VQDRIGITRTDAFQTRRITLHEWYAFPLVIWHGIFNLQTSERTFVAPKINTEPQISTPVQVCDMGKSEA
jgi:hypothetical protein